MKKSTYIFIAVIIIIVIIAICLFTLNTNNNKEELENGMGNETINEIANEMLNEEANELLENTNEIGNEVQNTQVEETTKNVVQNTTSTETFEETPATAEQKAIAIVKEDWKKANSSITVEGMNENGDYIVVVRDSQTTEALAFYHVNVANKTFVKREMN